MSLNHCESEIEEQEKEQKEESEEAEESKEIPENEEKQELEGRKIEGVTVKRKIYCVRIPEKPWQ